MTSLLSHSGSRLFCPQPASVSESSDGLPVDGERGGLVRGGKAQGWGMHALAATLVQRGEEEVHLEVHELHGHRAHLCQDRGPDGSLETGLLRSLKTRPQTVEDITENSIS